MTAFAEAQIVTDFARGAVAVAQSHGIGRLEANTVLLGWSGTPAGRRLLLRMLRDLAELGKSVLFLRVDDARGFGERRTIDVWWGGRGGNGDLMLILAHLVRQHRQWGGARLRVLRMVGRPEAAESVRAETVRLLDSVRVEAEVEVIVRDEPGRPFADIVGEHSAASDLTVLGMQRPTDADAEPYAEGLDALAAAAGTVLLVHSGISEEDVL